MAKEAGEGSHQARRGRAANVMSARGDLDSVVEVAAVAGRPCRASAGPWSSGSLTSDPWETSLSLDSVSGLIQHEQCSFASGRRMSHPDFVQTASWAAAVSCLMGACRR